MLQNLPLRSKQYLLAALTGLFCLVGYRFAIGPTLAVYGQYAALSADIAQQNEQHLNPITLKAKYAYYERQLLGYRSDTTQRQDHLLSVVAPLCQQHRVKLLSLPPAKKEAVESYALATRIILLEGGFLNLLRLLHNLEHSPSVGRVVSVQYLAVEDPSGAVSGLRAQVHLQQLLTGPSRSFGPEQKVAYEP